MAIYLIYRAIDAQALVGNIGGYIGLCLGYSFLQIPALILFIMRKLKKYYSALRHRRHSIGPLHIDVQENQLNNRPDLYQLAAEVQQLKERMNKYEFEFPTQIDLF